MMCKALVDTDPTTDRRPAATRSSRRIRTPRVAGHGLPPPPPWNLRHGGPIYFWRQLPSGEANTSPRRDAGYGGRGRRQRIRREGKNATSPPPFSSPPSPSWRDGCRGASELAVLEGAVAGHEAIPEDRLAGGQNLPLLPRCGGRAVVPHHGGCLSRRLPPTPFLACRPPPLPPKLAGRLSPSRRPPPPPSQSWWQEAKKREEETNMWAPLFLN